MTFKQAIGPGQPPAGLGCFAIEQRGKTEPKRTAGRGLSFSSTQEPPMGAGQILRSFSILPNQQGGLRELYEMFRIQCALAFGSREFDKCSAPGLFAERLSAEVESLCPGG